MLQGSGLSDEEIVQDISTGLFDSDADLFHNTFLITSTCAVSGVVLGLFYEIVRRIRKRQKVQYDNSKWLLYYTYWHSYLFFILFWGSFENLGSICAIQFFVITILMWLMEKLCFTTFLNIPWRALKYDDSGWFLTSFEVFANMVKHFLDCFVCLFVRGCNQGVKGEKKSSKSMLMNGYSKIVV